MLALRVDFPLESPDESTTTGVGVFDLRSALEAEQDYVPPFDLPPHDRLYFERHLRSLARYYRDVSEGRVALDSEVFPRAERRAYTLPKTMLHYGNGRTTEEIGVRWIELLRDALTAALADPDGPLLADFNSFLVFHAGVGHETGQLNDIRSVFLEKGDFDRFNNGPLAIGGVEIDEAWILPESPSLNGRAGLNGLLTKFFANQLGLPGLSNFADGLPAVGGWSLMDVGANSLGFVLADSLEPVVGFAAPHPMAWTKARLGWIDPLVVRRDTVVSLLASDRSGEFPKALQVPIDAEEYFLLENRQQRARLGAPEGQMVRGIEPDEVAWIDETEIELEHGIWMGLEEYDAFIPGSGVLVWHVDEGVIAANAASSAINNQPEWQGIALEEADGYRDIGHPVFERLRQIEGSPDDPFFVGGRTLFGVATQPDSRTNRGWETGIEIEVLSENGDLMQVAIRFGRSRPGWSQALEGDGRLQTADLDGDGADELIYEAAEGIGYADRNGIAPWRIGESRLLAIGDGNGDGRRAIFASEGAELSAWEVDAEEPIWRNSAAGEIQDAFFSPDPGSLSEFNDAVLVLERLETLDLFDAGGGELLEQIPRADFPGVAGVLSGGVHTDWGQHSVLDNEALFAPALGDLDGDGEIEWVLADRDGKVQWGFEASEVGESLLAPPALGDLDGDGLLEVVLVAAGGRVHVLRADGLEQANFPFAIPRFAGFGDLGFEPILFDIDANGNQEILVTGRSGIFAIEDSGQLLPGFPLLCAGVPSSAPAALDFDGDGRSELAALDSEALYVWDLQRIAPQYSGGRAYWPQARADAAGTRQVALSPQPDLLPATALLPGAEVYVYPNPVGAGEDAHLRFVLGAAGRVSLEVFDPLGAKVDQRKIDGLSPGEHEITWSIDRYSNGLYICRLVGSAADGRTGAVLVKMAVSR